MGFSWQVLTSALMVEARKRTETARGTSDGRYKQRMGATKAAQLFESAYERVIWELESEVDTVTKAKIAAKLADQVKSAQAAFGSLRTDAFWEMRERLDYSLADMAEEFGITRARAAQLLHREEYRERAREAADGAAGRKRRR